MGSTIYVLGEGGSVIPMAPPLPEGIQDRLDKGYLRQVNADGSDLVSPAGAAPAADGSALTRGEPPRPGKGANKAEWVAWAVSARGLAPDAAEAMTKLDLMELSDAPAAPVPPPAGGAAFTGTASGARGRPGDDAPKADWVEYAYRNGKGTRDDLKVFTRDDLIELMS